MGRPSERLMDREELADAESMFRSIVGFKAAGRPVPDPEEAAVRCARVGLQLVRHVQASREIASVKSD